MNTYYLVEIDGSVMEVRSSRPDGDEAFADVIDSCQALDRAAAKEIFKQRSAEPNAVYHY